MPLCMTLCRYERDRERIAQKPTIGIKSEESAILARIIYSLDNQLVTLVIIRQMAADIKTQAKILGER